MEQQPDAPFILWAATLVGVIIIVVVAVVFVPVEDITPVGDLDWLLYLGMFMALPAIVMIKRQRDRADDAMHMRHHDEQDRQQDLALNMISYALSEAPVFIGIAYYVMSGDQQGLLMLAGISLLLLLWARPRRT